MERRFACTACGKCCHGILPLTIDEAFVHGDKFPLVMLWTPVRQGARAYEKTAELGISIRLKNRKRAAVRIVPAVDLPSLFPCPQLTPDGLCAIHEDKPQRCRTMPFSASRDEGDQDDLLIPRAGWSCDTSPEAPVVYRNGKIVDREEFIREHDRLKADGDILKAYGQWLLESTPPLAMALQKTALRPTGGHVPVAFSTLIPRLPKVDIYDFADRQLPVMRVYAEKTAGHAELTAFHKRYVQGAGHLEKIGRLRR